MCLIVRIRVLVTAIVLASFSPVGLATGHGQPDGGHGGHLAVSLFIGRRTRVAAAEQFDVNRPATTPARQHLQMWSDMACATGLHRGGGTGGIIGALAL